MDAEKFEEEEEDRPKIAIVGKPNAGKSSLINKLIGKDRVMVSDIAGTTRDAIDTEVVRDGKEYIFIDTAGLRRKNKIKEGFGALQYHSYGSGDRAIGCRHIDDRCGGRCDRAGCEDCRYRT